MVDFSSHIKLDQVSPRYYAPESEMELASITRCEKVTTSIAATRSDGAALAASKVAEIINRCVAQQGRCVVGFGAGKCVLAVYDELVKLYFADKVSFADVVAFNLSELGLGVAESEPSNIARLQRYLFSRVDIEPGNIHTFSQEATKENVHRLCKAYEEEIEEFGGLDLVVCEVTKHSSLVFNEPGSTLTTSARLMLLGSASRTQVAEVYKCENSPTTAVTLGIANLMKSRNLVAVAWGEDMAVAVTDTVEGRITEQAPASYLQMHPSAQVVVDLEAAAQLTRISYPWKVASCEWTPYLIRRAIVWLCRQTGKPILKLTNRDYNDNGLSELVALYGSAYNVNIIIFNDLQHTITGWPGGKPNADDTHRPERATPYPKRVLAFGPQPDDVVVSMGGTLRRLVQQGHDVHVAFETNGDMAVNDEDLLRMVMLSERINTHFGIQPANTSQILKDITTFISNKEETDPDNENTRYLKGQIFTCEGIVACRYMGVQPNQIHDLQLPLSTQDAGRITDDVVEPIVQLLASIKPHQVFVADDMNDPLAIHEIAAKAVFMALDRLRDEPFIKDCRVWLYRGQWGQWNVDQVEMAVPMSPEEFRVKRDAILRYQSQIHDAPFRDDAEGKLSWQRSIDRNKAMADHYSRLGLASYEAIEAFVQYRPGK